MLQNAYFVAKIGADTAENEQHSAEILPTDALRRSSRPTRRRLLRLRSAAPSRARTRRAGAAARGSPRSYVFLFFSNFWIMFGKL